MHENTLKILTLNKLIYIFMKYSNILKYSGAFADNPNAITAYKI